LHAMIASFQCIACNYCIVAEHLHAKHCNVLQSLHRCMQCIAGGVGCNDAMMQRFKIEFH
jgi:hypothetical protein